MNESITQKELFERAMQDKTVSLREFFERIMQERHERYCKQFEEAESRVKLALEAKKDNTALLVSVLSLVLVVISLFWKR